MDIDIDMKTTFDPTDIFNVVKASMVQKEKLVKHPCGAYFQGMPSDPVTGFAAIPHKLAEPEGFTKIDFLHLSVLDLFDNKQQIRKLIRKEPKWGLLLRGDVIPQLFQIGNHSDLVRQIAPKSIQELADCISIIRPGKIDLLDQYLEDREGTREELYRYEKGSYAYKKGHAIAYAMIIVLQLHLIGAGIDLINTKNK